MDPFVVIAIGLFCFICITVAAIFFEANQSGKMIQGWADEHGYTVVEKQPPLINLGPFRWENPRGRTFYHITVSNDRGQRYTGWICCGAEWLGLFSRKVEMRWDAGEPLNASGTMSADETTWPPPKQLRMRNRVFGSDLCQNISNTIGLRCGQYGGGAATA